MRSLALQQLIYLDELITGMEKNREYLHDNLIDEVSKIINTQEGIVKDVMYFNSDEVLVLEVVLNLLSFNLFNEAIPTGEREIKAIEDYYGMEFVRNMSFENLDGTHWRFKSKGD